MEDVIYTVAAFNKEIKNLIDDSYKEIWIAGEISNLARPASGHLYFTLKDKDAQVRCAFFRGVGTNRSTTVKDGDAVHLRGRPSFYESRGQFQIIVKFLEPAGEGILRRKFDELKNRLYKEGLFGQMHKVQIPTMPNCIGVITSSSGAAIRDILSTLKRRYPITNVLVLPVTVQGDEAAPQIVRALTVANKNKNCDVVILARGGGSLEDLWAFNEELVVRAIFTSNIPIVTGIGHEIDVTLSDYVADFRAETPTAAAEATTPDSSDLIKIITSLNQRLKNSIEYILQSHSQYIDSFSIRLRHPADLLYAYRLRLHTIQSHHIFSFKTGVQKNEIKILKLHQKLNSLSPKPIVEKYQMYVNNISTSLVLTSQMLIEVQMNRLSSASARLRALSPYHTMHRGYAILTDGDSGNLITHTNTVRSGQKLRAQIADGSIESIVNHVKKRSDQMVVPNIKSPEKTPHKDE